MKRFLVLSLVLASCGAPKTSNPPEDKLAIMDAKLPIIRSWAPTCQNGMASKADCDDGDNLLWLGLLCFSGETDQCQFVPQAQDASGRMWRSPYRVNKDTKDSFSRDMAIGVLAYSLKTRDVVVFDKWFNYVKTHNNKLCPDASDGRCDLGDNIKTLSNLVGEEIGANSSSSVSYAKKASYEATLNAQVKSVPNGYQKHLVALQVMLLKAMSLSDTEWSNSTKKFLVSTQPNNPFFRWLAGDNNGAAGKWIQFAPVEENNNKTQWSTERADSEGFKNSMGWEFIFVNNLIRSDL